MSPHQEEDLRSLWQTQTHEEKPVMSTEALVRIETKMTRTVRWRNLRETAASVIVAVVFLAYAGWLPGTSTGAALMRVGSALSAMGAVVVLGKLRRDGSVLPPPASDAPTSEHLAHCRASLVRQRDLLRGVPAWYVGPFVPGFVLFMVGDWLVSRHPESVLVSMGTCVAVAVAVILLNRLGVRRLQTAIDALG